MEQAGAAAITVHGRTRSQMYRPSADWDCIRQVKEARLRPGHRERGHLYGGRCKKDV